MYNFENTASIFDLFFPSFLIPSYCSSLWTLLQVWLDEYSDDFRDPPMHSSLRLMCLQLRGRPALFPLAKHYDALLKKFQTEGHCTIIFLFVVHIVFVIGWEMCMDWHLSSWISEANYNLSSSVFCTSRYCGRLSSRLYRRTSLEQGGGRRWVR